jgi:hypothetical protein
MFSGRANEEHPSSTESAPCKPNEAARDLVLEKYCSALGYDEDIFALNTPAVPDSLNSLMTARFALALVDDDVSDPSAAS